MNKFNNNQYKKMIIKVSIACIIILIMIFIVGIFKCNNKTSSICLENRIYELFTKSILNKYNFNLGKISEYKKIIKRDEVMTTINNKNIASDTDYLLWVDTTNQFTYVLKKENNKWGEINKFSCSTGRKGHETPKGTFKIYGRDKWFFSERYQQGGKYWVGFNGNYLFHGLPMDKNKRILDYTLGEPASHGCIRLKVEDAKWIYENIPNKTTTYIS